MPSSCFPSVLAVVEFVAVIERLSPATASGWRWQMRNLEEPWSASQPPAITLVCSTNSMTTVSDKEKSFNQSHN